MTERISAREAIALVTDSFGELPPPGGEFPPDGPLSWVGYDDARARAAARTGEQESVVCGTATFGTASFGTTIDGRAPLGPVTAVLIAFEFGFLGGSLGERTGDRLEAAYDYARTHRLPVVSLVATGGSRMQEGMLALTQLQRVARQSALTREAGLAQIAVLRDPTTGGGWATLGAGADVTLALPGAQVAFAGSRVRPPDADPAAYTAEAQVAAGSVDALVPGDGLREALALWLDLLTRPTADPAPVPSALGGASDLPATGWDAVQRARSPERPRADAYLDAYFTRRAAIGGDRCGGTDDGVVCGFGRARDGRTVAYAAQRGTPTRPAGYRTAARLVRLAGRLRHPGPDAGGHPGRRERRGRRAAGGRCGHRGPVRGGGRRPDAGHHAGDRRGRFGRRARAGRSRQHLGHAGQLLLGHRAGVGGRDPQAARRRGPGDRFYHLRLRPQDLLDLGVIRGIAHRRHGG